MELYLEKYPAILNVKQVAEILGCSEKTVRQLVYDKKLISVQVGRLIRIPKDRLLDFLNAV